ncbi:hypothetical protein EV421DRAFT_1154619 [Armillaria borealis]|uniref:Uncharacterized protein n=1 Tax=Armillaria borealis TaxID=47425 RepID=A0AA39J575_9AGAR|nr:hypothetical protein EV421DRAFT_1154619 [Armillaria borealis]
MQAYSRFISKSGRESTSHIRGIQGYIKAFNSAIDVQHYSRITSGLHTGDLIISGTANLIMCSFPQELVEMFIDEASDDIVALWSCSPVSRSFLPRTRIYLFKTVQLSTIAECHKFHKLCIASPYLIHYVKELRITYYNGCTSPVLGGASFPSLMSLLPVGALERLEIVAYHWR